MKFTAMLDHADQIDRIIALWRRVRPDLDPSTTGIIGRIVRMEYFITRRVLQDLARYSINVGEFDVLAALRRQGEPYQLSPNQMQEMVLISSGALTNRINRLESAGLVKRTPDQDDRRGVNVSLTEKGFKVIEEAAGHHLTAEAELVEILTQEERETLTRLLKKLLSTQED